MKCTTPMHQAKRICSYGNPIQVYISDLNYDSLLATCRSLASSFFSSWNFDNLNDLGRFALDLYLHALDRGLWLLGAWGKRVQSSHSPGAQKRRSSRSSTRLPGEDPDLGARKRSPAFWTVRRRLGISRSMVSSCQRRVPTISLSISKTVWPSPSRRSSTQETIDFMNGKSMAYTSNGTGRPFQEFIVPDAGVIHGSIVITVDGVSWTEVTSLASSGSSDLNFVTEPLGDSQTRIVFGDG